MAEQINQGFMIPVENAESIYSNHLSVSLSFTDIRLYFSEVGPKGVWSEGSLPGVVLSPAIATKACVILNPEFAKAVRDSISKAIEQYEAKFGAMRSAPDQPTPETGLPLTP